MQCKYVCACGEFDCGLNGNVCHGPHTIDAPKKPRFLPLKSLIQDGGRALALFCSPSRRWQNILSSLQQVVLTGTHPTI